MENIVFNFFKELYKSEPLETINIDKIEIVNKFIFEEFIPFIDTLDIYQNENAVFELIKSNFYHWIDITRKPWLKDKFVIAFMGRFSAGKSSIINSILGENLLPVDITPTTAVSTYISYHPKTQIKAVDNDDEIKKVTIELFKSLTKDTLEEFPLAQVIRHFVVEYNNERLKEKTLLDTPGYDSIDEKDKRKALEVIREADTVFWILDINDGTIGADSLKFIKENLTKKPLYFILNKADVKTQTEQKSILGDIQKTLKQNEIKFENCILYSSKKSDYKREIENLIKEVKKKEQWDFFVSIKEIANEVIEQISINLKEYKKEIAEQEKERDKVQNEINKLVENLSNNRKIIQENDDIGIFGGICYMSVRKNVIDGLNNIEAVYQMIGDQLYKLSSINFLILQLEEKIKNYEEARNKTLDIKNKFSTLMEGI